MKTLVKSAALLIMITMSVSLSAQKFGYINTGELISNVPSVKEANSNIETYRKQLQSKYENMIKSLQTKYQTLEVKQKSGEISPKQLEVEASQLKEEEKKIAEFEQSSQQKIAQKSESLLKPLRDQIQSAIDAVASENGYDYIFDASTGTILYADKVTDVSAMVKAKLGL
jgi:outer membrane protein